MKTSDFNRRGRLLKPVSTEDALGQPSIGWVEVAPVWANIRHMSGLASIKAGAKSSEVQASVRIRYREDVLSGWRFTYKATAYDVKAIAPDMKRREYVDLICVVIQ
ncbi:MAG: head-tail adaptor protein [Aquabacterium sp.]|uniref:phage head closure protein n=1 Tax=Aquabacterium sp. TaxID=1872578 RepID=UPI001219A5C0|nr:phage head closure protein [Aquabacterium sp.]TAK84515.1 MAG: head-tail adaptor protein [Aquabacterium sp.]